MRSGRKLKGVRGGGIRSLPDAARESAVKDGGTVDVTVGTGPFGVAL
jgi:hypothetical protein